MVGGMRTKTLCLLSVRSLESRICTREREVPILLRWMRVYVDNVAITEDVVEKSGSNGFEPGRENLSKLRKNGMNVNRAQNMIRWLSDTRASLQEAIPLYLYITPLPEAHPVQSPSRAHVGAEDGTRTVTTRTMLIIHHKSRTHRFRQLSGSTATGRLVSSVLLPAERSIVSGVCGQRLCLYHQ